MIEGRSNDSADFQIFRAIFGYCFCIIVLPVFSFFVVKNAIFDKLGLQSIQSSVYSAAVAVIVLHIALGMYIYRAYSDSERKPEKPVKKD